MPKPAGLGALAMPKPGVLDGCPMGAEFTTHITTSHHELSQQLLVREVPNPRPAAQR
jgi:hypothetical protein